MLDSYIDVKADGTLVFKFTEVDIYKGTWELADENEKNNRYAVTWDNGNSAELVEPHEQDYIVLLIGDMIIEFSK